MQMHEVSVDSLFYNSHQTSSEPTQPPIYWVLGALSPGLKDQNVKLTTYSI